MRGFVFIEGFFIQGAASNDRISFKEDFFNDD